MSVLKNFRRLYQRVVPTKSHIHTSATLNLFWEKDEKSGYQEKRQLPNSKELVKEGLRQLKQEIALWSSEVKERFENDPIMIFRPGETDVFWDFTDPKSLDYWVVTTDSDNNEGYSKCTLTVNQQRNAVFAGDLSTKVPIDGRIKRSGYCNIRTTRARKSFKREAYIDWTSYNMLVMKVRGDGRSYMLNIHTKGYYDIMWNDVYNYVLYTRGGPYWQVSRIPFSKFFLSSKGRIQDKQFPLPTNRITNFGISAGDKINGSFGLEIQYIGCEFDPSHTEEFAYEQYETDGLIAGH